MTERLVHDFVYYTFSLTFTYLREVRMHFKYLSQREIRRLLLDVPSAATDAQGILRRNMKFIEPATRAAAGEDVRELEMQHESIGCPHCEYTSDGGHECGSCAYATSNWEPGANWPSARMSAVTACIELFAFGGLTGMDQDSANQHHVGLVHDAMSVDWDEVEPGSTAPLRFIGGHIEWANALMELEEIRLDVSWRGMSVTEQQLWLQNDRDVREAIVDEFLADCTFDNK